MNLNYQAITHLIYWLKCKGSGYIHKPKDPRDFKVETLGWGVGYTPKWQSKILKTYSTKDQKYFNNCVWQAATGAKEVDEKCVLSARSLTSYGAKNGLLSGNGWAALDGGQKALKDWGIMEEKDVNEDIDDWDTYANVDVKRYETDAAIHKTQSYWSIVNISEVLKAIDDGHPVQTAINWYTGFNQGGGFGAPWIISKNIGLKVGGHSVYIAGATLHSQGYNILICKNSYS
jgi:hypothetical protein